MKIKTTLFLIFLVLFVMGHAFAESDIDVFAQNILNDFKNSKYKELYEKMSLEAKRAMPYNEMVEFFNLEKEILGELERYEEIDSMQQIANNKSAMISRYAAYFINTGAIITITIVEEGEKLACQVLHVDSLIFSKPEVRKRFEALSFR